MGRNDRGGRYLLFAGQEMPGHEMDTACVHRLLRAMWVGGPLTMQEPAQPNLTAGGENGSHSYTWDWEQSTVTRVPTAVSEGATCPVSLKFYTVPPTSRVVQLKGGTSTFHLQRVVFILCVARGCGPPSPRSVLGRLATPWS